MTIRIRFRLGPEFDQAQVSKLQLASFAAELLTPAALMALVLGLWRFSVDLSLSSQFPISHGLFSHWQVWIAVGVLLLSCAAILNRHCRTGRGGGVATS